MIPEVKEDYEGDPQFEHLRYEGINYVPGAGSLQPRILVIGEAPGYYENKYKSPFMGESGTLLYRLMKRGGLDPENTYVTNVIKYRPPNNRTPTQAEIMAAKPHLIKEWKLLGRPPSIVAVGAVAKRVFNIAGNITKIAGKRVKGENVVIIPMVHPSFILRNPFQQDFHEKLWFDLRDLI